MSKPADFNQDGVTNGGLERRVEDTEFEDNEGEESDEYEEIDDEEERQVAGDEDEDEDEGEEVDKGTNTLTHLLLGNTNGATVENKAEYEDADEDADDGDDDDDDDDDDEYVEDGEGDYAAPPIPLNKKRSIDEVVDEEDSQGSKKIKAWNFKISRRSMSTVYRLPVHKFDSKNHFNK